MLAYGEIERAVVMHLEFRQAKAHMASLQVEVKLKFNHRKVDLHPSTCPRMKRIKLFCAIFKARTSCCFQRMR